MINFTKRAEYEERRRAILVRAQELAPASSRGTSSPTASSA